MEKNNLKTGKVGEKIARNYLQKTGYQIIKKNYRSPFGEVDIIAKKDYCLYFIEVKTRRSDRMGKPYEAVNKIKINRLKKIISYFLLQNHYQDYKLLIEVISIILGVNNQVIEFKHFKNILC